jgi:hypothetical protein
MRAALLVTFAAFAPSLCAQKGIAEPRAGLAFQPPKGWTELPGDQDRGATVRLFAGPQALASKGEGTHTPLLRVMFFATGGDAGKDEVDGLPRTTPFRDLEDFAKRGLGAKSAAKEPSKVGGVAGQRLTGKELPGDRVLLGQTLPVDGGEAAICVEVLGNQADKIKKEIDEALGSIAPIARVAAAKSAPPWLAEDWAGKDAAARAASRRKWADEVVAATLKNPELAYKASKAKHWTVLSVADPNFTKKAIAAAEAAREWLAKKLPELTKDAPLPAVLRVFDSVDHWNALQIVNGNSREYDSMRRELIVVNDRDNGGPNGFGPIARAVLWQLIDDVDPGALAAIPRWFDNGCWEFLRSSKFDGKKFEFVAGDVERGRIDYYRQNNKPMPMPWELMQEAIQRSPTDGKTEDPWAYTPDCARLMRWFWMHDGQQAFGKPTLVADYIKALGPARATVGPDPTADVATVGLNEAQQKDKNTRGYTWRDNVLKQINFVVVPLQPDAWVALDPKWLEFNKNFK